MGTRSTILNKNDHKLLENSIVSYGVIVTIEQLQQAAKRFTVSDQYVHKWIGELTKKGWLVRLKRELYVITTMESLGTTTLSPFKIAQKLAPESYISFEAALQFHGMFDQLLQATHSVTLENQQSRTIQSMSYRFTRTQAKYYFGFTQAVVENAYVNVATPEKALLDLLHFNRTFHAIDLVNEKLHDYIQDLNISQLLTFLIKEQTVVQRMVGFLFDRHDMDASDIHSLVSRRRGSSKMTNDSTQFNAKWRLYYHSHFDK